MSRAGDSDCPSDYEEGGGPPEAPEAPARKKSRLDYKGWECEQCPAAFKHKSSLTAHVKVKHSAAPPKFQCEKCDKSFKMRMRTNSRGT